MKEGKQFNVSLNWRVKNQLQAIKESNKSKFYGFKYSPLLRTIIGEWVDQQPVDIKQKIEQKLEDLDGDENALLHTLTGDLSRGEKALASL